VKPKDKLLSAINEYEVQVVNVWILVCYSHDMYLYIIVQYGICVSCLVVYMFSVFYTVRWFDVDWSVIFYTKWSLQTVILASTMVFLKFIQCSGLMLCSTIPVCFNGTVIRGPHIHFSHWHEPSAQCTLLHSSGIQYMPRTLQRRSSFTFINWWAFFSGMCTVFVKHY
jgi:hypothetical protein